MTEPRIYRASALGYSLENLVAPHLGYQPIPPPQWLQEKFDEGTRLEPLAIEKLRALGWDVIERQDEINSIGDYQFEVELEIIPGVAIIRGHLDGKGRRSNNGGMKVIEVKSMNPRTWQTFYDVGLSPKDKLLSRYQWQVSAYMLATGLPVCIVGWNKETEEIARTTLTEPPILLSDIAAKITKAEQYINDGVLPDDCQDYPCPYFYLHGEKVDPEPADENLEGLMAAWLEAKRKKGVYEGEEKALRDMIVEYVGQEGKAKVKGKSGVTVSVSYQEGGFVSYEKKGGWTTTVTAPRMKKENNATHDG